MAFDVSFRGKNCFEFCRSGRRLIEINIKSHFKGRCEARTTLVKLRFPLFQFPMVLNSNSFKEVARVLEKVRPGNGDGRFIFSIPG